MHNYLKLVSLIIITNSLLSGAAPQDTKKTIFGELKNSIIATGSRRVFKLTPDGKTTTLCKGYNVTDVTMLKNGNILIADGHDVREVTPKQKVVFRYQPKIPKGKNKGDGAFSCQRLDNGNTLIGENSTARVLEVNKEGKVVFELQVKTNGGGNHHQLRIVRKLKNGNYLVCLSGSKLVREYTPDGKIVLEIKTPPLAFKAVRLANGNTMISHLNAITEYDKNSKVVWEFKDSDLNGMKINNMTGFQVLPNGNLVIGCYSAYRNGGKMGMFEINRKKELIWRYFNPKKDGTMMGVQMIGLTKKK